MEGHTNDAAHTLKLSTHPSEYLHWKLSIDGPVARLAMNIQQHRAQREGEYELKLNSYDINVDLELADAIQRVRFEHPGVRCLVLESAIDRVFCSGANIYMLGSSTHAFKVNFCKFTNETRLALEDLAAGGVATLAALNGTASGGGYELALACERIVLIDDGNSAVSFPEAPLLAVLPGTGGLTRLVDKRKVRRDRADVFSTLVEGIRGKRALEWGLVDALAPKSRWAATVTEEIQKAVAKSPERPGPGIELFPIVPEQTEGSLNYRYVRVSLDPSRRVAEVTLRGPEEQEPQSGEDLRRRGADAWALRAFRELDDALVRLRFMFPKIGFLALKTEGDLERVLAADRGLVAAQNHWLGRQILAHQKRVLKRLDLTARSMFAFLEPGSCFGGSLLEVALAADRTYMLDDPSRPVQIAVSELNAGSLPMSNGLSRLATRFLGDPEAVPRILAQKGPMETKTANKLGLVTFAPDDIDWEDEVRIAIEERVNFSPDAMTGMEANLRFPGPETMETKIFARLSTWQNWIFQRPNAVGPRGALSLYGKQLRPDFDWTRT